MDLPTIDELFQTKFLSQTKKLANGNIIKVFSRKQRGSSNNFMYSCHLCGFIDIGDEQALHFHVLDKMHRDLFNLKVLPFRSWMKDVVIEEDKKTCELGDCSQLKSMLDNLCKMNLTQSKSKNSEVMKVEMKSRNQKRFSSNEKKGSSKSKRRRLRSPTERRSRSRSRKSSKRRHRSYSKKRRDDSSDVSSHASPRRVCGPQNIDYKRKNVSDDPSPSFLSICRLLVTLEQHISKYSNDISRLFSLSLSLEREKIGSSNSLLTLDNLKLLDQMKNHMKDQIVLGLLPMQMLGIARTFVNDFERLVKENGPVKVKQENILIDIEMPEF